MTNYNKRLDEIIQVLAMGEQGAADDFAVGAIDDVTYQVRDDVARGQAKQALTSLIKELVAEAKPNKKPQFFCQGCDKSEERGYNQALGEFEQNLLKALGSK